MPVNHIDDHRDAVLVGGVDQCLKVRPFAEPFVNAEVADWQVPPIDRRTDVG